MVYAVLTRCPVFGGKVASFDATKARPFPALKNVVQISSGVAVVADNTWSAMQGRKVLDIKWDEGPNANQSSAAITRMFSELVAKPADKIARKEGGDRVPRWQRPARRWKRFTKRLTYRTRRWSR